MVNVCINNLLLTGPMVIPLAMAHVWVLLIKRVREDISPGD